MTMAGLMIQSLLLRIAPTTPQNQLAKEITLSKRNMLFCGKGTGAMYIQ